MLKTSELQSQIALNSQAIAELEVEKEAVKDQVRFFKTLIRKHPTADLWIIELNEYCFLLQYINKRIKQYVKLQRALKNEMAYKIRYNRMVKEIEAITEKAKIEGWEVVIVGDDNEQN
jgi:hypothetical protein